MRISGQLLIFFIVVISLVGGVCLPNRSVIDRIINGKLERIDFFLKKTIEEGREIPATFQEFRLFCYRFQLGSPYDAYGNRLHYQAIGKQSYLLKSYGEDGRENSVISQYDISRSNLSPQPFTFWKYSHPKGSRLRVYPASLLLGTRNDDGYVARLVINTETHQRFLAVTKSADDFYMVSHHDGIEEFFWVPSSNKLIYSATGMERYEDGLFLWDLETRNTTNLLRRFKSDKSKGPIGLDVDHQRFYLSLSSLVKPDKIYVYLMAANGVKLDPMEFFSQQNLYVVMPSKVADGTPVFSKATFQRGKPWYEWMVPGKDILGRESGNVIQKEWVQLPLKGSVGTVLDRWQEFSIRHPQSPIFAYSLWWLSHVYLDAVRLIKKSNVEQSEVIRSYGAELSKALSKLAVAPRYLRAIAGSLHDRFINEGSIEANISTLTIPSDIDADR